MADLRSCYFCGTGPGGSLESYGVVPSALDPSRDEQRSVVLCPDCRNKLTALLEPVVDAAATPTPSPTGSPGDLSPADDDVTGLAEATGGSGSPDRSSSDESPDSGAAAGDAAGAGASAGESTGADQSPADDATAAEAPGEAADAGDSVDDSPADRSGTADRSGREVTFDEGDESSGADSDGGLAASSGGSDEGPPRSRPRDPSAESLMGDDSEAYRKVIRLLQNRDFPVSRVEIEDLAASAYELSPGECSDAIDAIVQKGLLVEEEGTLMRPED